MWVGINRGSPAAPVCCRGRAAAAARRAGGVGRARRRGGHERREPLERTRPSRRPCPSCSRLSSAAGSIGSRCARRTREPRRSRPPRRRLSRAARTAYPRWRRTARCTCIGSMRSRTRTTRRAPSTSSARCAPTTRPASARARSCSRGWSATSSCCRASALLNGREVGEEITFVQVYQEMHPLCRKHKITKFGCKRVARSYAFEEESVPASRPCLKPTTRLTAGR